MIPPDQPDRPAPPLRQWLAQLVARAIGRPQPLAALYTRIDDNAGWQPAAAAAHDRDSGAAADLYRDTLRQWRDNALLRRIVNTISDFVIGDELRLTSDHPAMQRFLDAFWEHPENRLGLRLAEMSDELSRAGDLFVVLFRNPGDGLSYLRFVTRDQVATIETAANDWERELAVVQHAAPDGDGTPQRWPTPAAARRSTRAVILHYAVNRPLGAQFGESDVATIVRWVARYERLIEDRARLHMALRAFLWFVKVPPNRIAEAARQYGRAPEAGSIIVHGPGEEWSVQAPTLHAADASHDLHAVRQLIGTGSGLPPHWLSERGSNRAEAQAMELPAVRFLRRRQRYFGHVLQDITYHAYRRAHVLLPDRWPALPTDDYTQLFRLHTAPIGRTDHGDVAQAAQALAQAFRLAADALPARSPTLTAHATRLLFKFAGEPLREETLAQIMAEAFPP